MNRETVQGQPVTDEQINAWADEAEAGYPVEQLRKRGRQPLGDGPSAVVPVRIDSALLAALGERAEREHVSRSEAIRAAIRAWVGVVSWRHIPPPSNMTSQLRVRFWSPQANLRFPT